MFPLEIKYMENIKLYNGDCLDVMKSIPDKSVDLILCDLPYSETRAKWDAVVDIDLMWAQYDRIVKDNGAIVLFGNEPFSSRLRMSNPNLYRYDWKWIKNNCTGFANANYRPMRKYEDIMVFSKANASAGGKNNSMTYNPQDIIPINKKTKNKKGRFGSIDDNNVNRGDNNVMNSNSEYVQAYTNYPNNILYFDVETDRFHPTQKPILLLEYLIKTYSNEKCVVLDNTMGSGSTGVACVNTNRKFIGIELDKKYFDIAEKRISEANNKKQQKTLF